MNAGVTSYCPISRKRIRSCEDDACEFTPISKRINNLHIRSGMLETDEVLDENCNEFHQDCQNLNRTADLQRHRHCEHASTSQQVPGGQVGMMDCSVNNLGQQHSHFPCAIPAQVQSLHHQLPLMSTTHLTQEQQFVDKFQYNPELGEHDNPNYYRINGLLYDLHLSRLQRIGKQ